ncbi:hypothetical protein DYB28_014288, partial [Aphanomyces astaci]
MSKVRSIFMRSDNGGDPKTTSRISPATELALDGDVESPRVISSPSLTKQPTLPMSTSSTFGRLTIRVIEGSDLSLAKLDPAHEALSTSTTSGWVKAFRRSSLTGRKPTADTKLPPTAAAVCVVVHITGESPHLYSTDCILALQDSWNEEFMIDTVCCDEVLTLYGIDRMRNPPYYDVLAEDMDHHPGCIGKGTYAASASASLLTPAHLHVCVSVVSIPLSRLPENEEIEQWYSFTGNTTSQTFTRAAIRVSLKFTAVAPSSPLHHHPPRHPSFIGHPSSDPSTHVDEAMEDEAASTDLCLPTGLVDYVLLVGPPSPRCPDADKTPADNVILKRYPPHDRTDFPLPTKIEWFCFPGGYEATLSEEHCRRPPHPKQFTFVLSGGADGLSKCYGSCVWVYEPIGAASLPTRWHPQCLCMLSRVPNLLEFMQDAAIALMWQYMHGVDLAEAYCTHLTTTIPRPIPNLLDVSITLAGLTWRLSMPRRQQRNPTANKHPELPSSLSGADRGRSEPPLSVLLPPLPYSMSVFFDCFPVAVIVQLVILGLCEHRIVVHSTQLSLLCPVTETLKALMYPFRWQHPYVPMLPRILSEYLQAPLPYILGVHS